MSALEAAYANGQLAALIKLGLAQPSPGSVGISMPKAPGLPAVGAPSKLPMPSMNTNPGPSMGQQAAKISMLQPTHAAVKGSPLLGGKASEPPAVTPAVTTPQTVKSVFDVHEQSKTRLEPANKLADELCTSCRRPKHYGPCLKPARTPPAGVPMKRANFNFGMLGSDAHSQNRPATSGAYNASVVSEEPGRSFGNTSQATQNTETVSIDQVGNMPDGEPAALG